MGDDKTPEVSEITRSRKPNSRARLLESARRIGQKVDSSDHGGEARLVARAKRGDKQAVGELYQRHVDMIYRYTYARVRDAIVAEDLTAQVFLKALEGLSHYEHTGVPFRAWLYRIAHARTVDYWRKQQRRQEVELMETLPARGPLPEEIVATRSEWDTAVALMGQLTDDQRDVLVLRFIEQMSLAEVAETMNKTVGAIKALQHRALASLARLQGPQITLPSEQDG